MRIDGLGEGEPEGHQDGAVDEVLDLDARARPHAEQVARLRPPLRIGDVVDAVLLYVERPVRIAQLQAAKLAHRALPVKDPVACTPVGLGAIGRRRCGRLSIGTWQKELSMVAPLERVRLGVRGHGEHRGPERRGLPRSPAL